MRNSILDLCLFGSPFHTPRAVLWNIKTLGLTCWAQCLMQNAYYAAAELCRAFSGDDDGERAVQRVGAHRVQRDLR